MNKILIELTIPILDYTYDVFIPVGKTGAKVVKNLKQALEDLFDSNINIAGVLLDSNGNFIDLNSYIKNTCLKNGSKVVLL